MGGQATAGDAYVISRYIDAPLLVGGKKFDLRIYVARARLPQPLRMYSSAEASRTFCAFQYTNEHVRELDNEMVCTLPERPAAPRVPKRLGTARRARLVATGAPDECGDPEELRRSHQSHGLKWSLKNLARVHRGDARPRGGGEADGRHRLADCALAQGGAEREHSAPAARRGARLRKSRDARSDAPCSAAPQNVMIHDALFESLRLRRDDRHGAQAVAARGARALDLVARPTSLTPSPSAVGQRFAVALDHHRRRQAPEDAVDLRAPRPRRPAPLRRRRRRRRRRRARPRTR